MQEVLYSLIITQGLSKLYTGIFWAVAVMLHSYRTQLLSNFGVNAQQVEAT
jgi:hypothetical protein